MRRRALAGALLAGLLAGPAHATDLDEGAPPPVPYESIRTLRRLQENIAHGDQAAQAALPSLLATIGTRFLDADPASWRDPRNGHAAVLFLFSGGKPAVIRTVLGRSTMPRELDRLLKGALAYAEGQDQIARDLLAPIDPRSVSANVGGQLALVEGSLLAASDKTKAGHFFDLARLLAPGSLIEEAALRRQVFLNTDAADPATFVALARQYLHRFRGSVYAANFRQRFAATVLRLAEAGDPATLARLDPAIAELIPAQGRALYLAVARSAIVRGHADATRLAASRVAVLGVADTDAARAKLYLDASSIISDDLPRGVAALEAIDGSKLSAEDADLRTAALAVAQAVQEPVPDTVAPEAGVGASDPTPVMDEARRALARGDAVLKASP